MLHIHLLNSNWHIPLALPHIVCAEPASIVIRPPSEFEAAAGQTLQLACVAYGNPIPNITWTTSSQNLDLTGNVSCEIVPIGEEMFLLCFLQLSELASVNGTQLTCTASNGVSGAAVAPNSANIFMSVTPPLTG